MWIFGGARESTVEEMRGLVIGRLVADPHTWLYSRDSRATSRLSARPEEMLSPRPSRLFSEKLPTGIPPGRIRLPRLLVSSREIVPN